MHELFPGIFEKENKLFTLNAVPGVSVYGEKLINENGKEFREWIPWRSKLGAAIKNKIKQMPIKPGSNVLYLGCAEGTTVSHVSDIVGENGIVFGVDVSARSMSEFVQMAEQRKNIVPILADANNPAEYAQYIKGTKIGVIFQDIAQKNQAEIFSKNAELFLKKGAFGLLTIKAKSIDQQKQTAQIIENETSQLKKQFNIIEIISLAPLEKEHAIALCRKN